MKNTSIQEIINYVNACNKEKHYSFMLTRGISLEISNRLCHIDRIYQISSDKISVQNLFHKDVKLMCLIFVFNEKTYASIVSFKEYENLFVKNSLIDDFTIINTIEDFCNLYKKAIQSHK